MVVITDIQKHTPKLLLGKVLSLVSCAAQCAAPLGQFILGKLLYQFDDFVFFPTMIVSVLTLILAFFSVYLLQDKKRMNLSI